MKKGKLFDAADDTRFLFPPHRFKSTLGLKKFMMELAFV